MRAPLFEGAIARHASCIVVLKVHVQERITPHKFVNVHTIGPPQLHASFEPYASLWRAAAELGRRMPDWLDGPFDEIDAEAVANDVDT